MKQLQKCPKCGVIDDYITFGNNNDLSVKVTSVVEATEDICVYCNEKIIPISFEIQEN